MKQDARKGLQKKLKLMDYIIQSSCWIKLITNEMDFHYTASSDLQQEHADTTASKDLTNYKQLVLHLKYTLLHSYAEM